MYKTFIGDDGREMVQISEGPFVMGSRDNDSDPMKTRASSLFEDLLSG